MKYKSERIKGCLIIKSRSGDTLLERINRKCRDKNIINLQFIHDKIYYVFILYK